MGGLSEPRVVVNFLEEMRHSETHKCGAAFLDLSHLGGDGAGSLGEVAFAPGAARDA
jgi:hypothetical protein